MCRQTSGYSCGPAAAVSFLHAHGIAATEREMAEVSSTTRFFGTSASGMVRGLARKIPGTLRVRNLSLDQLRSLGRPALVVIRLPVVNHWIVVRGFEDGRVLVNDPRGIELMTLDALERDWTGLAVWSER
jgi:predicted double-glycine peptidase